MATKGDFAKDMTTVAFLFRIVISPVLQEK